MAGSRAHSVFTVRECCRDGVDDRGIDGKLAGLGVKMEIEAHDVAVDGILLSVCARASANRFKILRVVREK